MNWKQLQQLVPMAGSSPDFKACLAAFPQLELAKTTPQNPVYHAEGDVWTHTMMVVESLLAMPDYQQATRAQQEIVFLAALLHDVAKCSTTVIDPVTGAIGQPGHSRKGALDARIALWDVEVPFAAREEICRLINVHQVPFFALEQSRRGVTPEFTVRELSWQVDIRLLAMLAEADIRGRICPDPQRILDAIELFRELARDLRELLRALGIEKIALVGHDRGARVATRFAKDYPEMVDRLVVMDNVPTRIVAREFNAQVARSYWFFIFNQVPDLPEALISGREDLWLRHLFSDWCYNPLAIDGDAFRTYVEAYRRPGALRGAMSDYRANAEDVAQDKVDADIKIACPTLSLWGADFHAVGKMFDMAAIWAEMASDLRTLPIPECGHLPQEEQPEQVNAALLDFLQGWAL